MSNRLAANRRRHRLFLEACEPRAMLSAAPLPTPQTELAGEMRSFFSFQLSETTLASVASTGAESGTVNFSNGFGGVVLSTDARGLATTNGAPAGAPWMGIRAPMLDPIAFPVPGMPTPEAPASDQGIAAAPIRTRPSEPVAAPPPASASPVVSPSPIVEAPPSLATSRPTLRAPSTPTFGPPADEPAANRATSPALAALPNDATGEIEPRWLPATFSSAERHRTDTLALDVHDALASATGLSQSTAALQPTRVTCQAFCDVTPTRLSAGAREQENSRVDHAGAVPHFREEALPATEAAWRAMYDAAILDWQAPRAPTGEAASPAGCAPQEVVPATTPVDAAGMRAEDAPEPGEIAASLWDADWRFVVPLVAAIATSVLVSDKLGAAEESELPARGPSLVRRRRAAPDPSRRR